MTVGALGEESARGDLAYAVAMWRVRAVDLAGVVDAAVACLVAGMDGPLLSELAGVDTQEARYVVEPLVRAVLEEQDLDVLNVGSPERAAITLLLRRLLADEVSTHDVVCWAHKHIGHAGEDDLQVFVELDDMFDLHEHAGAFRAIDLDHWIREEAQAFVDGKPSPGNAARAWRG